MSSLKYRPMAVIGITALILIFSAVISDYIFSCGLVFLAVGAVLTALLLISKDFGKFPVLVYICASLIFSGTLLMCNSLFDSDASLKYAGQQCDITAVVTDNKSVGSNSETYTLKTETINGRKIETKILACTKTSFRFDSGDVINFNSKLTDNISEKDLIDRLYSVSDGEYLYTFLTSDNGISLVRTGENTLQRRLYLIRNGIKSRIYSFLPCKEGAVTVAMLIGDKTDIDRDIKSNFSHSGISHLFAISGLHLSVWVMSFYLILKKLIRRRRIPEIICILFTIAFASLTGFTASVCRAGLMLAVLLFGKIFNEESDSLNSLGLSLFIILLIKPMSAVSVSLLLSFCATLGIITLYPFIERKTNEKLFIIENKNIRKFFKYILNLAEISICASLFTLPVSAFFIGSVSIFAPVTNVMVSLAATSQMIFGGLTALFSSLKFISNPLAFLCGIICKYVLFVSGFISEIPFCSINSDSDYFRYALVIITVGVLCAVILTESVKKRLISITAIILSVSILSSCLYYFNDFSKTEVTAFNTGGICIQLKQGGHSVILGCGGKDNYPEDYVSSKLCKSVDLLLVPGRSKHLSSMLLYFCDSCSPEKIITCESNQSLSLMDSDYYVTDGFEYKISEDSVLKYYSEADNSFAQYRCKNYRVSVIFKCTDSDAFPTEFYTSDILIVSEIVPDDFDYSSFKNVIISADSKNSDDIISSLNNENVYMLCDFKDIEFYINKNGKAQIYCSKG